jgi:hypothetical protein
MTDPEFVIPTKPEDLLTSEDPVEDIETSLALNDLDGYEIYLISITCPRLKHFFGVTTGVVDRLCDQSTSISNHENLDVLFSLIRFGTNVFYKSVIPL